MCGKTLTWQEQEQCVDTLIQLNYNTRSEKSEDDWTEKLNRVYLQREEEEKKITDEKDSRHDPTSHKQILHDFQPMNLWKIV